MKQSGLFIEPLAGASTRLAGILRAIQSGDPLAPLTVVVPSTYAVLFLRRDLGRQGLVNVRFMVMPRLSELLGAPPLAAKDLRPLTPVIEAATVRMVASDGDGMLEAIRHHSSFHTSLRSTLRELRYADVEALERLEARGGLRAEIVRLYRRFRQRTSAYYDREALALSAAEAVHQGHAAGLSDLGHIVFHLINDLTPAETQLVERLASSWDCSVVLGITGESAADASIRKLTQRLASVMGPPQESEPPLVQAETRLLVASDTREEIRWIARSITSNAHQGTPFHRMAVLYRHPEPYAALVTEELVLAGIPASGPSPVSLAGTAVGRTLSRLIALADGEFSRDSVIEWLTACPVAPPDVSREGFHPSQWDAVSRNAGVVKGIGQWRERLGHYARQMEQQARNVDKEELSEAAIARMLRAARDARALRAFVTDLHGRLRAPAEGQPWKDFVAWSLALLDAYLDDTGLPESEEANLEALRNGLRELETLDDVEQGSSLNSFRMALDELLSAPATRKGRFGEGVFVGPLGAAIGLSFDRIYVVGMVEGLIPPRLSDDPLMPDRERREAGGASAGLPLRSERADSERYTYLAALASTRSRVLTYARGDASAQRAQYPSMWFLDEASRLHGSQVFATSLGTLRGQPWLAAVASMEDGLHQVQGMAPADLHDYDLYRLWLWNASGQRIDSHHLAASEPALARALEMDCQRASSSLTAYDGDLSSIAAQGRRLRLAEQPILSATGLERWAACPFRYFLSNVLHIAALEQPEEVTTISARERGSLVHAILERFVHTVQDEDSMPGPGEPWSVEHSQLLISIAQDAFRDAEARGVTGKQLLWELAQAEILADLLAFLEEDFRLRRDYGVSPRYVEVGFGTAQANGQDAPPAEWAMPGQGRLRFRGIVDRLDMNPSGDVALVLDYKTGRPDGYDGLKNDPVDRGKRFQLPIYGLAIRKLLGAHVRIAVAYWFVTARGGFALRPPEPADLDDLEKAFGDALAVVADGIQGGLFPANPGLNISASQENCRHCDFDKLCSTRRAIHWESKRGDSRLASYLRMATGTRQQEDS